LLHRVLDDPNGKSRPENRGKTFEKCGKMMKNLENLRTNRGNASKILCFDHKAGEFESFFWMSFNATR
jgi:hypothetical protein